MSFHGQARRIETTQAAIRLPDEIAFLVGHGVSLEALGEAARVAEACAVSADTALLACGLLDEVTFYRLLARQVGLRFRDGLPDVHPMARFPEAAMAGLVPLAGGDPAPNEYAWAPKGGDIAKLLRASGDLGDHLSIATPSAIRDRVIAVRAVSIAARAADGLARMAPDLSFRAGVTIGQAVALSVLCVLVALAGDRWPAETWLALTSLLAFAFLGNTALRLAAVLEPASVAPASPPRRAPDRDLPPYTLLIALHREARVLPKLMRAITALDYPAPKLDVKLIIEEGDLETVAALQDLRLPGYVQVIVAPPGAPRTKPRALNVGLELARGKFVAVYDAEDVPDPGQLRLAVSTFERAEPDVACLQARLVIDNAADTLLTRLFAIEYATLFDVTNPALARFDMPVPLGGTSNHFRTAILKGLGGWDAWNVTEDADLGIRLAAAGYRVADLASSTLEEAPRHAGSWMRQRTRWMKGFLQVSITHSRRPLRNLGRFGAARLFGAMAMTLGTVVSAFTFPVLTIFAVDALVSGRLVEATSPVEVLTAALALTVFATGLVALVLPPIEALRRRRWWGLLPLVLLMPFYSALVSLAAWRGFIELLSAPERWNKTEHGLARTSRAAFIAAAAGPAPLPRAAVPR